MTRVLVSNLPALRFRRLVGAGFLVTAAMFVDPWNPGLAETSATWQPEITEKLVKLPASSLKKTLERDFSASPLAQATREVEGQMGHKVQSLGDLRSAIDQADGEVKTELRHQFLAEKRDYLELIKEHQDMRRQHLETRAKIYGWLLKKVALERGAETGEQAHLAKLQEDARSRFDRTLDQIDTKLFATPASPESRYSREYSKNLSAMNVLVAAINAHPMNQRANVDEAQVGKPEYLRRLIADNESEIALIKQEGEILGYMAKLVALDATGLAEDIAGGDADGDGEAENADLGAAVELFVN